MYYYIAHVAVTASTLNADAGTTVSGTTIYTVTATDPEGELLSYSMTQSPENNYFELNDSEHPLSIFQCSEYLTLYDLLLGECM